MSWIDGPCNDEMPPGRPTVVRSAGPAEEWPAPWPVTPGSATIQSGVGRLAPGVLGSGPIEGFSRAGETYRFRPVGPVTVTPPPRVTESIPALRAMLDGAPPRWGTSWPSGSPERYTARLCLVNYGRLADILDAAVWRQAVANHRWLRNMADDLRFGEDGYWQIRRGVESLKWLVQREHRGEGFLPRRDLVRYEPGSTS